METERLHWLDGLRGVSIIMMVFFHIFFDLEYLDLYPSDLFSGFWLYFGNFIRFTFLAVAGFSVYLSYKNRLPYSNFLNHQFWRAVKLFGIAMLITLVTFIFIPGDFIRFGVLHLISIGILLTALLINNPKILFVLIILSLIFGAIFDQIILNTSLFFPFGIKPTNFYTIDYFPIFPWIAIIFAGNLLARIMDKYSLIINPSLPSRLKFLEEIGKKSLLIYLVHQPILLGLIWLLFISNMLK